MRSLRGARVLPLPEDMPVSVEEPLVPDEVEPLPVVPGALFPMVPGVVPWLPDVVSPVTPVVLEPEPMLPELPLMEEPELLPAPAPVVLGLVAVLPVAEPEVLPAPPPMVAAGLVAVLGPVGAGMPGVALPMPVLPGLVDEPEPEDWA